MMLHIPDVFAARITIGQWDILDRAWILMNCGGMLQLVNMVNQGTFVCGGSVH